MKYKFLLFDIDDTLLDFKGCELPALEDAMKKNGMTLTAEAYEIYKLINKELWQNFELGIYSKNEILTLRFDLLFVQLGVFGDAAQMSHDFLVAMGSYIKYEPEAKELLDHLKGKATMAIITNGAKLSQEGKLKHTGLGEYFQYIYISDDVGSHKPEETYFDIVAKGIDGFDKNEALIVGDGLKSDILGGINYGIDTCWYNKWKGPVTEGIEATYEITNLLALLKILQ